MSDLKTIFNANAVLREFYSIDLSKLCQHTVPADYKAGEVIFSINESVQTYYVIEQGSVLLTSELGEERVLSNHESFGDECVVGLGVAFCTVVAQSDCRLLLISKAAMINLNQAKTNEFSKKNLFHNIGKERWQNKPARKNTSAKPAYIGNAVAWLSCILLPMLIVYALSYLDYPPNINQSSLIYIFLSAVFMWYLRLVPEFIPALYLLLGTMLLSLAPASVALSGFYSNAFFLAIALSVLAAIIKISGLSYRLLLYLFYLLGNHKFWRHFALFFSGAVITPIIPSANARATMVSPLFEEALSLHKTKKGSMEYQRMLATTVGGFSLLSAIFLTSKSVNFIALGMLSVQDQYNFQFYNWLVSAAPVALVLIPFYAFFSWLMFRNKSEDCINTQFLKQQIHILGKFSMSEVFAVFATIIFGFIVLGSNVHNLEISWLALFLAVCLFIMGILTRANFNTSIDWDFLIFLSILLGFANTVNYLEIPQWMGHYTGWITDIIHTGFAAFALVLSAAIFVLRLLLPINITVIILAGVLIPVVADTGISPWLVVFMILLLAESYTYNFSASYVMQFLSSIDDNASYPRIIWLQVIVYLVKVLAILATIPYWVSIGLLVES